MKLKLSCPTRTDVALAPLTTFRMGGRVPLLVEPRNREEFKAAIGELRREGLSFRVLGGGANLLIDDTGLDDIVVLSSGLSYTMRESEDTRVLRLGAGLSIPRFVTQTRDMGRTGAECLVGIPGTIGGATVMNAGGRHGWLSHIVRRVRVLLPDGQEEELAVNDEMFGYRSSIFGDELIVLETVVELEEGDRDRSDEQIRTYLKEKNLAQPLTRKTAGCVFKNPPDGSAGKLLEAAGVKGWREGDAEVSEIHANFILNLGEARMVDTSRLIRRMQHAVLEQSGVELHTEVRLWARDNR